MTSRKRLLVVFAAFIGLALLYFGEPIARGLPFLRGDMGSFFYPQRMFFARSVRGGDLPLWTPLLYCGFPFLAEPQNAVLYPLTWLFVLFPSPGTIWVTLILHLAIAGAGAAWLAKESLGAEDWAAFCGGVVYAFSGFLCMHMGHLNQVMTCAWTPWVFWAAIRWLKDPDRKKLAMLVALYGVQFLPGGAENTAYLTIFLVGLGVASLWRNGEETWPRRLLPTAGLVGALALGAGLAGAQLVPTFELSRYSARSGGLAFDYATKNSLPPQKALVDLVAPNYWGHYGPAGSRLEGIPASELAGYVGLVAVVLAVLGASRDWRNWWIRFWAIAAVLALLLAFGCHAPLYKAFFLAGLQHFRNPSRFLFLADLAVAVLAAGGVNVLLKSEEWPRNLCKGRWLAYVLFVVGLTALWVSFGSAPLGLLEEKPFLKLITADIGLTLLACAAAWGALGVPMTRRRILLLLSLLLPLFGFARESEFQNLGPVDARTRLATEEFANRVRTLLGSHRAFTFHDLDLRPNRNMLFGLPDVSGYEGGLAPLARFYELQNRMSADSHLAKTEGRRLTDLLGARMVLDRGRLTDQDGAQVVVVGPHRALLNLSAVPRASFVTRFTVGPDEAILRRMADEAWDPETEVLLAGGPELAGVPREELVAWPMPEIIESGNDRVVCDVAAPAEGFLVVTDTYYPGWEAAVDGEPTEILRANYLFRAVALPQGRHRVVFEYRPASLRAGAALTVICALVILLIAFGKRRRTAQT